MLRRYRRLRLRDLPNYECSVAEGSVLLMLAFLVSAALGIVRQMLFNAQFGAGTVADAYYAAFRLPDTVGALLAGGTLANAMVPVLLGVLRSNGQAAVNRLTNQVLTALHAVLLPLVLLCMLFTPTFVQTLLAPGFDAETRALAVTLTRLMLLEVLLLGLNGVALAHLTAHNRFLLPALAVALRNIALIIGILVTMFFPQVGIYGPTIGAVCDALIQFFVLRPGLRQPGFRLRPNWHFRDRHLREVVRLLLPSGLSVAVNYAGNIVDTAFASLARSAGSVSAVFNANLLLGLPVRLLGAAIAQAAFPRMADQAAAGQWRAMRATLNRTMAAACGLGLLATVALLLLGRPTIALLFERGEFSVAAGTLVYQLLAIYAVGLVFYIATEVLTRGLMALHDTRTALFTNLLQLAGRSALIPLLLGPLDVFAIPVAFAITSSLETLILWLVLRAKLRRRELGEGIEGRG